MSDRKKVLVAYANAGAGHRKAAQAVEKALRSITSGSVDIEAIDTLNYSSPFLKKGYPATYLFLINKIPTLWGMGYYMFDTRILYRAIISRLRRINNSIHCTGLVDFIKGYNPDVIVNTHFLGSEVMADMKRRGMLSGTKLVSVVTDYFMHSFWVDEAIDYYCVAQEDSRRHLMKRGIPKERIRVFGVPVDGKFAEKKDRKTLCAKLNLRGDLRTILIGSGGFGVGPVKELVKEVSRIDIPSQILVVCGKNPRLYEEISGIAESSASDLKVYEFVDNMDELMEISDIMITKSGGMTSSEAMAKDLAMVVTSAIPGQEARNCKYLVRSGGALHARNAKEAKEILISLLESEEKLNDLKENIKGIKKPNSAYDIAQFVLGL